MKKEKNFIMLLIFIKRSSSLNNILLFKIYLSVSVDNW